MSNKTKKRVTKKKQKQQIEVFLVSIVTITLSLIGAFKFGVVGDAFSGGARLVFGQYPIVVFIMIIVYAITRSLFPEKLDKMPAHTRLGLLLGVLAFLIAISFPENKTWTGKLAFNSIVNKDFLKIFSEPTLPAYGGFIGVSLFSALSYLLAREGTLIFTIALVIASIGLTFSPSTLKKPFVALFKGIKGFFSGLKKATKKLVPVKDDTKPVTKTTVPEIHDSADTITEVIDVEEVAQKQKSVFMTADKQKQKEVPDATKEDQMKLNLEGDTEPKDKNVLHIDSERAFENYQLPPISLLEGSKRVGKSNLNQSSAKEKGKQIIQVLDQFGIEAELLAIHIGPSVTKFELKPDSNVKLNRISAIQDNIMMELAVTSLRIEAPIPGRAAVGIEIPNVEMLPVRLREIIVNTPHFFNKDNIWVALGKNLMGEPISIALNKMPHLLIAGATGSGKSVCINSIITSILLSKHPEELKLILIDPKKVEFTPFIDIPHLMKPVVTDPALAASTLKQVVIEMESRYEKFSNNGVRNITAYNQNAKEKGIAIMPWIVVIIDELADLMNVAGKEVETSIQRITQLARASGIHLIVATQRPSVDVVTGVIKANIPSRIAFAVSSAVDSRTILDTVGAEKLLGYGDMLYIPMGEPSATRAQGVFVSDQEVNLVTKYSKDQAKPKFDEAFENITVEKNQEGVNAALDDPLIDEAIKVVIEAKKASTSYLQRQFRIGYNRAASIMDVLEARGIISIQDGSRPREVAYRTMEEYYESLVDNNETHEEE